MKHFLDLITKPKIDTMLEHTRQILSMSKCRKRDIDNLKKWIAGTGCLSRSETVYLEMADDLLNTTKYDDVINRSDSIIEDCTFWLEYAIERVSTQS